MSALRRDLIERKLWMVVALLAVLVIAVPLFLLKRSSADGSPVLPAPPAANSATTTATTTPTQAPKAVPVKVELARIARNPFSSGVAKLSSKPASQSGSSSSSSSSASSSTATTTASTTATTPSMVSPAPATGDSGSSSGSTTSSTPATPSVPDSSPTSTIASVPPSTGGGTSDKVQSWTIYSVSMRFGDNKAPVRENIARLTALPSARNPQVMFFGVMAGGKQAVFGLGDGVQHAGPGLCRPSRTNCSEIVLSAGESEAVGWASDTGKMVEAILHVSKITSRITHSHAEALKAYHHVSAAGMCDISLAQPVSYDPNTGTVESFPKSACKAKAAAAPFTSFKATP